MTDARKRGDHYESAQLGQELQKFMKAKGINPLKNAAPLLLQAPVFMSFFFALRGMAYCPVDSMSTGGMFWFTDLTMKDPFWALPFLTSATFFLQVLWLWLWYSIFYSIITFYNSLDSELRVPDLIRWDPR